MLFVPTNKGKKERERERKRGESLPKPAAVFIERLTAFILRFPNSEGFLNFVNNKIRKCD